MSNSKDIEKQLEKAKVKAEASTKPNPKLIKAIEEKQQYVNKPFSK